jgi:hypothetical protein
VPDNPPPIWWTYAGGLDWGYADPFAFVLFGIDHVGKKHAIESLTDSRLTNEQQAAAIAALLSKWHVKPSRCLIGFDNSMQNRPTLNGIVGEAPIEAFYRAGLKCVPVSNSQEVQRGGWSVIREMLIAPGEPSPEVVFWRGYNVDLIHSVATATYDKMIAEKLNHDESSHLVQAMRYCFAARPKQSVMPESAKSRQEQYVETNQAFLTADLRERNARLGVDETGKPLVRRRRERGMAGA